MTTNPTRSAVEATATGMAVAPSEDASAMIAVMRMEDVLPHFGRTQIADMMDALLARAESAEAERDAGDVVWKSSVALLEAQDARIKTSEHKAQCALDSHEGQVRNTLAFKAERDQLRAELTAARETIAAVTKQREDADHDADLARSQLGSVAMDNADLRATIARANAKEPTT